MYTMIKRQMARFDLDMSKIRAQTYDGGSSLAGHLTGVHGLMIQDYPRAVYIYCFSHALNRVVVNAVQVPSVQEMKRTLGIVGKFFVTPRRRTLLVGEVRACETTARGRRKQAPRTPSETRWSDLANTVDDVLRLYKPLLKTLRKISKDNSFENSVINQAKSLRTKLIQFDFVLTMMVWM